MAAVSLQPITPAAPGAADQTPARPAAPAAGGNAQTDAAPNDTVNFSGAAVHAAQPGQNPGQAGAEFVARGPAIFEALNGGAPGTAPTAPAPASQVAATPNAPASPSANVASAQPPAAATAQTGATLLSANTQQEQQQQLAQLDQLLSTLGIDPQSIPLFNQLALLLYLNDPAGLEHFVQQLQALTPIASNPTKANNAPQNAASATGSATNAGVQAAATTDASPNAQAQASGLTPQFQELQLSLATEGQGAQQPSGGAVDSSGHALNISA
jgi:hypothetical protein